MHACRLRTINDHYNIDSHSLDNHYRYGNVEGLEHNEPDAVHCSAPEHTEPETLYSTADDTISAEGQSDHSCINATDCIAYGTNDLEDECNSEIYETIS